MGWFSTIIKAITKPIASVIGGVLGAVGVNLGSNKTDKYASQTAQSKEELDQTNQATNKLRGVKADISTTQADDVGGEASGVLTDMQGYAGYKTLGRKAKLGGGM